MRAGSAPAHRFVSRSGLTDGAIHSCPGSASTRPRCRSSRAVPCPSTGRPWTLPKDCIWAATRGEAPEPQPRSNTPVHTRRGRRLPGVDGKSPPIAGEYLVEFGDGGARALGVGPDCVDYGEKVGAGFDQGPAILLRDAADRAARNDRRFAPVAQQIGVGLVLGGFGGTRKE